MKFRSLRSMQRLTESSPRGVKATKKLRSDLPRRRRAQISPILLSSRKPTETSDFSFDSSACTYFAAGEVSCESSRVSVGSEIEVKSSLRKRNFGETEAIESWSQRAKSAKGQSGGGDGGVEASESSCVESNSGAICCGGFVESKLKLNEAKAIEDNEGSRAVTKSEASEVISISSSGVPLCSDSTVKCGENRAAVPEFELPGGSSHYNYFDESFTVSDSTIEQRPPEIFAVDDSGFACTEKFSYDEVSNYSSSQSFSELQSDSFSDLTPSLYFDSGSQFSEISVGESTPSPTFALLVQYRDEFSRSSTVVDLNVPLQVYTNQSTYLKFEDDEVEESYQRLRSRERNQQYLRDYIEDYSSTTEYGGLILQQRSHMIRWIVEVSTATGLQPETKFLGVSLFDRFLSKGYFRSKRTLQIVGIACLTLATRIEENQPYNSVREKSFHVGSNVYSRCEVVAMEWLVQEVLNFQCFLPTTYNFLWFYLKAAEADEEMERRAKYLAVLQLSDPVQLCYWPSTVAAALVILASLEGNPDASLQQVIETHVRTHGEDLHECIESLEWLLRYV